MPIRQYIGARYVPKFFENPNGTSEWLPNVIYEPLTIVTYANNSYTSKKMIPASIGNPAENANYWAATGIYNAQVEEYRQEVAELSDDVTDLSNNLSSVSNNVTLIDDRLSLIDDRKVIFIGDSYCSNNVGGSGYPEGIFTRFALWAGVQNSSKCYHLGGAGFLGNSQGKTFYDLAEDAVDDAFFDSDTVTDIFIAGGLNDSGNDGTDIRNARTTCLTYLHQHFPNALIYLCCVGGSVNGSTNKELYNTVRSSYYDSLPNFAISIRNSAIPMMLMDSFSDDGIHPNGNGADRIGKLLANAFRFRASYPVIDIHSPIGGSLLTNGDVTSALTMQLRFSSNGIYLKNGGGMTPASAINATYNQGATFKVGSTNNTKQTLTPNATSLNDIFYSIPARCYIYATGETWSTLNGTFVIIATGTNTADVYFKCNSAPKNASSTQVRFDDFTNIFIYVG